MAQFDFWGADNDVIELLEAILASGQFGVAPDYSLLTDVDRVFYTMSDKLRAFIAEKGSLYITGQFSDGSLAFREFTRVTHERILLVDRELSAPYLTFSRPCCKQHANGLWLLSPGHVQLPRYYGGGQIAITKPSESVKNAYKLLVRMIYSQTLPIKALPRHRIGKQGIALLKDGQAIVKSRGMWRTFDGQVVEIQE